MRFWLLSTVVVLFAVAAGNSQESKSKETGKETGKETKPDGKEPAEFMGRSYDQWRKDLKSTDPSKRETAMKAVLMFGLPKAAEAVPDIIADLARQKKFPVDLSVRVNGTMALNTYFLHATNAKKTPEAKVIKDALVVYRIGLKDPQVIMKVRSLQGLVYLGPTAREALDDVIALTRDTSTWEVRKEAIPVMVMLAPNEKGTADPKAIIALRKASDVKDESSHLVRVVAVTGLGILGKESVLPELRKAMEDPSKEVRLAAVQALVHAKEKALPDLRKAIADQPKEIRLLAVQGLGAAGKEKALFDLRKILDDPEKEMRLTALNTISALKEGMSDQDKTATIKKVSGMLAVERDPIVTIWGNMTIMNIHGKCDKIHIEPVVKRLSDKEAPVRAQAFQALSACGVEARPFAAKTLLDLVEDKDLDTAVTAIDTLVMIRAYEAIPRLQMLTKDAKSHPDLKDAAESALDNFELIKAQEKKGKDKK